jgi:hypothetical protein
MAIEPAVVCVAAFVGAADGEVGVCFHTRIVPWRRRMANAESAG